MLFKRLKLFGVLLLALLLANTVSAALNDLNFLHQKADTDASMVWPMLPNESLAQLAAKFYPNNPSMQRKFTLKTKRLNKVNLSTNTRYKKLTAITIPNLQSLSVEAGTIKRLHHQSSNKRLQVSYNIKSKAEKTKFTLSSIPKRLVKQYEALLERNSFLKAEIAKLNKRLVYLENKLGQLRLILDKSLTLPPKKKLKNLDAERELAKKKQPKLKRKLIASSSTSKQVQESSHLYFSSKLLWLALFLFGLLVAVASFLISKYREKRYASLVGVIRQQTPATSFNVTTAESALKEGELLPSTTLNTDTIVEEHTDKSVLQEAKVMVGKGLPEEAIEHLKWNIKANPKNAITSWLYLLGLLRQQNLKDEFEKFALEMHQNFNVMTPLWEYHEIAMVVPQSLEEFPYIMERLTEKWPDEQLTNYLKKLILDNRSGERSGFSQAVIGEILLLVDVLEAREVGAGLLESD